MAPWFFELIGVTPAGTRFELVFWLLGVVLGAFIMWREWMGGRSPRSSPSAWIVGATLLGFGGYRWVMTAFSGELFFGTTGLKLPTYGVAMATAFIITLIGMYRDAERQPYGVNGEQVVDMLFWLIIGGMIGARVLFFITEWQHYVQICRAPAEGVARDCLAILRVWEGGLVFYGGFVGCVIGGLLWARNNKINFLAAADVGVPYLALGHCIGRLGCLAAGCCYGNECDVAWALTFPMDSHAFQDQFAAGDIAAREALLALGHSRPVHPTQLYEAAAELGIYLVLMFGVRPRRRFAGQVFLTWMALYALVRFVVEIFRGDAVRGFVARIPVEAINTWAGFAPDNPTFLSTSQTVSLGMAVAAASIVAYRVFTARQTASP